MKKVFVMPSLAIDGERIDKVGHINGLNFHSPDTFLGGVKLPSEDFKLNPASLAIEIEAAVELSPRDDMWKTLYDEHTMDITIKDERGCELHIPNARIIQRIKITGRIPRRMKKYLKRIHGVNWKQYHPNAENEVNINSK
jgi:hypothetical protein